MNLKELYALTQKDPSSISNIYLKSSSRTMGAW